MNALLEGTSERYAAFLSYTHREPDRSVAIWLQHRIERFRVPRALRNEACPDGRLGKVFRDESELSIAPDLREELERRLDRSRALIVLCSERSAVSPYVDTEIRYYLTTERRSRILPVLLEGDPAKAFPRALREGRGDSPGSGEFLAASLMGGSDDKPRQVKRTALLKIVAKLIDCDYDDLAQRDRTRRRRQAGLFSAGTALMLGLILILALTSLESARRASRLGGSLERSERTAQARLLARRALLEGAKGKHDLALLLAAQAWNFDHDAGGEAASQIDNALRELLSGPALSVRLLAPTKDRIPVAASISEDGTSLACGLVEGEIPEVVRNPSQARGQVLVWDLASPSAPRALPGCESAVVWLHHRSRENQLFALGSDGVLRRWSLEEPDRAPWSLALPDADHQGAWALHPSASFLARLNRRGLVSLLQLDANSPLPVVLEHPDDSSSEAIEEGQVTNFTSPLRFDPTGRWLAAAVGTPRVRLWKWREGRSPDPLPLGEADKATSFQGVQFLDGGEVLLALGAEGRQSWKTADGSAGAFVASNLLSFGPSCVAERSGLLATGAIQGGDILLFENASKGAGSEQRLLAEAKSVLALATDVQGERFLAGYANGELRLWRRDISTGRKRILDLESFAWIPTETDNEALLRDSFERIGFLARPRALAIDETERSVFVGHDAFTKPAILRRLDLDKGTLTSLLERPSALESLDSMQSMGRQQVWSIGVHSERDGDTIFAATAFGLLAWNESRTGARAQRIPVDLAELRCLALAPNSLELALGNAQGSVAWIVPTRPEAAVIRSLGKGAIHDLAVDRRGGRLAAACEDGSVVLWDRANPQSITTVGRHEGPALSVAFGPNDQVLLSGGRDRSVRLWALDPQVELLRRWNLERGEPSSIAFHPRGRWIAIGVDQSAEDREFSPERELAVDATGPPQTSRFDAEVRLYSLAHPDAEPLRHPLGRIGVRALRFSPSGRRLVAASDESKLLVLNDPVPDELIESLRSLLDRNLSFEEWNAVMPERPYQETFAGKGVPR